MLETELQVEVTYESTEARGRPDNYGSLSSDRRAKIDSGKVDLASITVRARLGPLEAAACRVIVMQEGFGETEEEVKTRLKKIAMDDVAAQLRLLTSPGPKSEDELRVLELLRCDIERLVRWLGPKNEEGGAGDSSAGQMPLAPPSEGAERPSCPDPDGGMTLKKDCVVDVRLGTLVGTARARGYDTLEHLHQRVTRFEKMVVARAVADLQARVDARLDKD